MFEWSNSIVQSSVRRLIYRFRYSVPRYELEDLRQEAAIVHLRLAYSHGPAEMAARLGADSSLDAQQATWMALFKKTLFHRFCTLVKFQHRTVPVVSDYRSGDSDALVSSSGLDEFRAFEISSDLERAPAILQLLHNSSWDDDKVRMRKPKRLPDGTLESAQVVMQRLAGRDYRNNYVEQLALVV